MTRAMLQTATFSTVCSPTARAPWLQQHLLAACFHQHLRRSEQDRGFRACSFSYGCCVGCCFILRSICVLWGCCFVCYRGVVFRSPLICVLPFFQALKMLLKDGKGHWKLEARSLGQALKRKGLPWAALSALKRKELPRSCV